jgi:hypothetical protein
MIHDITYPADIRRTRLSGCKVPTVSRTVNRLFKIMQKLLVIVALFNDLEPYYFPSKYKL